MEEILIWTVNDEQHFFYNLYLKPLMRPIYSNIPFLRTKVFSHKSINNINDNVSEFNNFFLLQFIYSKVNIEQLKL